MGNAQVADGFGESNAYYNPALAPFAREQYLESSFSAMTFDRNLQMLQFSAPLKPQAGIMVAVIHGGVTNIDGRDASGYHTQTYSVNEYAFMIGFGTKIGQRTALGLRFGYYYADYFEYVKPANSLSFSIGLKVQASKNLQLGATAEDVGGKYVWDTSVLYEESGKETTDHLPMRLRGGAAYRLLDQKLLISGEVGTQITQHKVASRTPSVTGGTLTEVSDETSLRLSKPFARLGAEWSPDLPFTLRLGVDQLGQNASPSAGFGLKQKLGELRLNLDYAAKLEPYQTGILHLLTVRLGL